MNDFINHKINYQHPIASNNIDIFKMGNADLHFNHQNQNKDNDNKNPAAMYANIVQENKY
jgi:hypothetical protein